MKRFFADAVRGCLGCCGGAVRLTTTLRDAAVGVGVGVGVGEYRE